MTYRKLSTTFGLITLLISSLILFNACEDNFAPKSNNDNCWKIEENEFYINWDDVDAAGPFIVEVFYSSDYDKNYLNDSTFLHWNRIEKIETSNKHFISTKIYTENNYHWLVTDKNTGTVVKENSLYFPYNDMSLTSGDYSVIEIYSDHNIPINFQYDDIYIDDKVEFTVNRNNNTLSFGFRGIFTNGTYSHDVFYSEAIKKEGRTLEIPTNMSVRVDSGSQSFTSFFKFDFENCTIEYQDEIGRHFKMEKI